LKFQITNPKKQTNNNDQISKSQTREQSLRTGLEFGIYDLFGIWCLEFVILDTILQGKAIYLWPGPEDQAFNVRASR